MGQRDRLVQDLKRCNNYFDMAGKFTIPVRKLHAKFSKA